MFSHEEYAAMQDRAGLLDRSARGRLRLIGSDRRAYLQGLLTNDIVALSPGMGCYAALLTPQGRMISDMRVSELGDAVLIDLPGQTAEVVRTRLADFIFSEDVEVEDVHDSIAQLGLYGPEASAILTAVVTRPAMIEAGGHLERDDNDQPAARRNRLDSMPRDANTRWNFAGTPLIVVRSEDYGVPGFELFVERGLFGDLDHALQEAGAVRVTAETAEVSRVEAGRPEFGVDMNEHTIPLEAGIEDRAISMTKGCYVGQEIIIRVLHRGHGRVAKRLVGFIGPAEDGNFERGDRLLVGDEPPKEVGSVTSGVWSPRLRRPIGLGYVYRDHAEPGTIVSVAGKVGAAERPVTIVTLPFIHSASE